MVPVTMLRQMVGRQAYPSIDGEENTYLKRDKSPILILISLDGPRDPDRERICCESWETFVLPTGMGFDIYSY